MIFELGSYHIGDWDNFQARKIGLATQRLLAASFGGDSEHLLQVTTKHCQRALRVNISTWNQDQRTAFNDFSTVLYQIPDLPDWTRTEKERVITIIQAKAAADEVTYLKQLQTHLRLRRAIISLGSS